MKKGFTLIELLAVIVILGIILGIAVPSVLSIIEKAQLDAFIKSNEMIQDAAVKYLAVNDTNYPNDIGDTNEISLNDLQTNGFMEAIKAPKGNSNCGGYVLVTKVQENKYDYTPILRCDDENVINTTQDSLVGYWKFDGNTLNYTPENITVIASGTNTAQNRFGNDDKARNFDGIDDYIDITDMTFYGEFTQMMWVSISSYDTRMWTAGKADSNIKFGQLYGNFFVRVFSSNDQTVELPPLNEWVHLALVREVDNTVNLYVNGVQHSLYQGVPQSGATSFGKIGTSSDGSGQYHDGLIDDLRLYSRALTATEIKEIYNIEKIATK